MSFQNITTIAMASSRNTQSRASNADSTVSLENLRLGGGIHKFSVLFQDSDSEENEKKQDETIQTEDVDQNYFKAFQNKFADKTEGQRHQILKALREDAHIQSLAKAVFDFHMTDDR